MRIDHEWRIVMPGAEVHSTWESRAMAEVELERLGATKGKQGWSLWNRYSFRIFGWWVEIEKEAL